MIAKFLKKTYALATAELKKINFINLSKVTVIGALVIIAVRAPFISKKYEFVNSIYSPEYEALKATYKPIIKNRNLAFENLINDLEKGKISKNEFILKYRLVKENSNRQLKEYPSKKKALQNNYKYRGFNGYYLFLLSIGTPILALITSVFFIFNVLNPIYTNLGKIIFVSIGGLFMATALYQILWALFAQQLFNGDFPDSWYDNILFYAPFLVTSICILLFYHYNSIETNLKNIINRLIIFIVKSNEYIDKEDNKTQYFKDYMKEFKKITK